MRARQEQKTHLHGEPSESDPDLSHRSCSFTIWTSNRRSSAVNAQYLDQSTKKLRARAPKHASDKIAQQPPRDIFIRADRTVNIGAFGVDLTEKSFLQQRPHEVGDRGVHPIAPRCREPVTHFGGRRLAGNRNTCITSSSRSVKSFAGGRPMPVPSCSGASFDLVFQIWFWKCNEPGECRQGRKARVRVEKRSLRSTDRFVGFKQSVLAHLEEERGALDAERRLGGLATVPTEGAQGVIDQVAFVGVEFFLQRPDLGGFLGQRRGLNRRRIAFRLPKTLGRFGRFRNRAPATAARISSAGPG